MAEGPANNVVRPVFGRKSPSVPRELPPPPTEPAASSELDGMNEDMAYFLRAKGTFAQAMQRANEVEQYVSRLQGFARKERNIRLRQENLQGSSLQSLSEALLHSTKMHWAEKPSYYLAVIAELSRRLDSIGVSITTNKRKEGMSDEEAVELLQNIFLGDTLFALSRSHRAIDACKKAEVVSNAIFDQPGFAPDFEKVDAHRSDLMYAPLSQLCDIILDSPHSQWFAEPSYFGAVIVELDERTKAIKTILQRV